MLKSHLLAQIFKEIKYLFFLSLFLSTSSFSQNKINGKSHNVINNNYSFLDGILKNKQLVLLGEQSHGDGATFDEKVNMIKYLHEQLGFNTIVFESGLYDNYKAYKEHSLNKKELTIYNESVGHLWSESASFQNLLTYISERESLKDTIKILGFDCQEGSLFENNFIQDLKKTFQKHQILLTENTLEKIDKAFIYRDLDAVATIKKDSLELFQELNYVVKEFEKIPQLNFDEKIIKQTFLSKMADASFEIKQLQKQKIAIQNPRDEQMAKNLLFLTEIYPQEKMICWGASYHFSNGIKNYEYTDITEQYLQQQSEIEKKTYGHSDYEAGDGQKLLTDALPMGEILKKQFKEKLYSIAFSSYEGEYGLVNTKFLTIIKPPINSIEQLLTETRNDKIYVEFDKNNPSTLYCSALGNLPIKANWNSVFDGLLFIKKSYPPSSRTYEKEIKTNENESFFSITGEIKNFKTNKRISNSDIYIKNSSTSIVTNKKGEFIFNIPKSNFNDSIIISSLGYYSDTLSVAQLIKKQRKLLHIKLTPQSNKTFLLDEIVILNTKKTLTAEEIVEKAKNNIETNYFQNPYNQQFYYRTQYVRNGNVTFNEEAAIETYNPNGINGRNDPTANFYGEVLELRNTTNNLANSKFRSSNDMGFILYRDVILSKTNVVYRKESFDLKKEGIEIYENKKVYKISFINKSPGTYSTGYGYPAPSYSKGIIYIDTKDFAVLKYEHYVIRKPYKQKDKSMVQSIHKIIETYKLIDGKYFLNYCNEITKNIVTSPEDTTFLSESYSVHNLMSTDINTKNIKNITRPILNLSQNVKTPNNEEFWKLNNFILEDDNIEFN